MATMMHQKSIPADPSRTLKVIGAGYSRTGTVSFAMALQTLLKGPVCHSGTAGLVREESFMLKLLSVLNADPSKDHAMINNTLRCMYAGYVGVTDAPACLFTGELAEIYPDAIVICTTRDPVRWWESFKEVAKTINLWWLDVVFFPMPTLRYFGQWLKGLRNRHAVVYGYDHDGGDNTLGANHLQVHAEYLKRVVPASRLFFFNVKDGWAPLCKILDCPIPDEPFPHANDKVAVQKFIEGLVKDALVRWLQIFSGIGVLAGSVYWALR